MDFVPQMEDYLQNPASGLFQLSREHFQDFVQNLCLPSFSTGGKEISFTGSQVMRCSVLRFFTIELEPTVN